MRAVLQVSVMGMGTDSGDASKVDRKSKRGTGVSR